jgi:hypothetical protein
MRKSFSRLVRVDCGESPTDLVLRELRQLLSASPYFALRLVHCSCDDKSIVLSGRVPSYYLKQLAQTLAGQVDGAKSIDNRLEVA